MQRGRKQALLFHVKYIIHPFFPPQRSTGSTCGPVGVSALKWRELPGVTVRPGGVCRAHRGNLYGPSFACIHWEHSCEIYTWHTLPAFFPLLLSTADPKSSPLHTEHLWSMAEFETRFSMNVFSCARCHWSTLHFWSLLSSGSWGCHDGFPYGFFYKVIDNVSLCRYSIFKLFFTFSTWIKPELILHLLLCPGPGTWDTLKVRNDNSKCN